MKQVLLITGGTGKLGSQLVPSLASKGYFVAFTSTSREAIDRFNDRESLGNKVLGVRSNLLDPSGVQDLVTDLEREGLSVSWLVNNARSLEALKLPADGIAERHQFLAQLELDVVVPYELTMKLATSGFHQLRTVVNIGSQYGAVAPNPLLYGGTLLDSPVQYGVGKAALSHLTKELAVRLAPKSIRVNCVAFGGVEGRASPEFVRHYSTLCPAGRMLRDAEVTGPVEFLLSESSSAINGQTVLADGGWTLW